MRCTGVDDRSADRLIDHQREGSEYKRPPFGMH